MRLNDFPPDLLSQVLGQLARSVNPANELAHASRNGLFNARFVCRKWDALATKHLFHTVTLRHDRVVPRHGDERGNQFKSWNRLLDNEAVRNAAQRAVIYSAPSNMYHNADYKAWCKWEETGEYPSFTNAIDRIVQLPNLSEVHLRFSDVCRGVRESDSEYHSMWDENIEPIATRLATLNACFKALAVRAKDDGASRVRSLVLENVQNLSLESLTTPEMSSVVKDINSLSITVTEEWNEHGPDRDVFCDERWQFEPHLQKDVLPLFSESLTSLSLGFRENWGTMPGKFDGKGLFYPQLKSLTLFKYVFSHHDQIDWILAQTSLTSLRLVQCQVAYLLRTDTESLQRWGVSTHDWEELPDGAYDYWGADDRTYRFDGTWETIFDKIRTKLPNLTDFRFNNADMSEQVFTFESDENVLSPDRYILFDSGTLPSPWIEAEKDGDMEFGNNDPTPGDLNDTEIPDDYPELNRGRETVEGDSRAFKDLLQAVADRRKSSEHEA